MPDLTPNRVNRTHSGSGVWVLVHRKSSPGDPLGQPGLQPSARGQASSSQEPCHLFIWCSLPVLVALLTCGEHSRNELNSDEDANTDTSLPILPERGRHYLCPLGNLRDFLTGGSSFKREEEECGVGPAKYWLIV